MAEKSKSLIATMLESQKELNDWINFDALEKEERDHLLETFSYGIIEESVEFRKCCRHKKFWKTHISPANISGIHEELADILAYVANIALVLGLDENQLKEIFLEKYQINQKRKRQGA